MPKIPGALPLCLVLLLPPGAQAQPATSAAPMAVPVVDSIPQAVDTPWPGGAITLAIDASDTTRGLYRGTETIPVAPGTDHLVLMLPRWIPGDHSPTGTMDQFVDVRFLVDGKPIAWHRDPVEVFAFHLDLPPGTREVTARFIHTSPLIGSEGRISMTREMFDLQWDRMSLYPAGHYVRRIRIRPQLTVPAGWSLASALDGRSDEGTTVRWAETDYATLVDSPVYAGANFKRFELGHGVAMNVVADKPDNLAITPEHLAAYSALVEEALATFASRHFDHYDFLLGLTDRMGGIGLEHHRSSENTMGPDTFTKWAEKDWDRNVIAHEFTHSWNGKFRRPARLWTPDYRTPMQDNLLWVYEGQTQFWGLVLAARAGVQSKDMVLGQLANYAGLFTQWPGRAWRSVEDTTFDPIIANRRPKPFPSLDRNEDYYLEGALLWLEADQIIRKGTGGARGLDDFARAFFGIRDGDWGEVTYDRADIIAGLNAVYPYDWDGFIRSRFETPDQPPPLRGIEMAGYRLVFRDTPNPNDKAAMEDGKYLDLFHSIGVVIGSDGKVAGCRWDSAAFNAGIVTGARIIAVNGLAYDQEAMKAAITAAKTGNAAAGQPITLIIQRGDRVLTLPVDYHDGLRWPWLERVGSGEAGLDQLLAPRRPQPK
ncbi:MAG: M61 family metallopeptidase [Sphingomonadales bacterium]|nr:M61 family metallopeptidase [Sphingomonadales bacterium]